MGISTEGSQDLRRKCFSHEHTVLGEAKAQLQHRQAKAHGVPQNSCRSREMLCTAIRKGIIGGHNFASSCALSDACFLMPMAAY